MTYKSIGIARTPLWLDFFLIISIFESCFKVLIILWASFRNKPYPHK